MGGAPPISQVVQTSFRSESGWGEVGGVEGSAAAAGPDSEGALAASPPEYASVGRCLPCKRVLRLLACSQACEQIRLASSALDPSCVEGVWPLEAGSVLAWHGQWTEALAPSCGPIWLNSAKRLKGVMPVAWEGGRA